MFSPRDLKILNKIQTKTPTASLYLNTDQRNLKPKSIRANFRNLLKKLEKLFGEEQTKKIRRRFYLRLKKDTKGLVFFANPKENIFYEYQLLRPVDNAIHFEKNLHLTPLVKMLDEYERYLLTIFDKAKVKIFSVYLGKIEKPVIKIKTEFPGKHKMGGWSQARYQRHIENHMDLHLKRVVKIIDDFSRKFDFNHLILAGNIEAISNLKKILPKILKDKISGEFKAEIFASDSKILSLAQKVEEGTERQKEKEKIEAWQRFLGKNSKSCFGLEKVIEAANEKRISEMYLDLNLKKSGAICFACHGLNIQNKNICPICGEVTEKTDLVDELVQAVLAQNGKIEFVANNKELKKLEGVGAKLRY
jgi:peptide chain release factor subunit 1